MAKNNAQKLNHIWIPSSFKKVDLPEGDSARKEVLSQYDGKLALVNDFHNCVDNGYLFARLKVDANDRECYYAQRIGEDGTLNDIRMHYHDLGDLLVQDHGTMFRHDF